MWTDEDGIHHAKIVFDDEVNRPGFGGGSDPI
jgi:hypothetical protein